MLSLWDIIGLIVLVGPLFIVLMGLVYVGIKTGIADRRRRSKELKKDVEISNQMMQHERTKTDVQHYIEDVRSQKGVSVAESEDGMFLFIKWLMRIIVLPFALLSYEAFRTFNILRIGGSQFLPHASAIALLSSSIMVVSIYYGFFVKYE